MNAAGWLFLVIALGLAVCVTIWGWRSLFRPPHKEEE